MIGLTRDDVGQLDGAIAAHVGWLAARGISVPAKPRMTVREPGGEPVALSKEEIAALPPPHVEIARLTGLEVLQVLANASGSENAKANKLNVAVLTSLRQLCTFRSRAVGIERFRAVHLARSGHKRRKTKGEALVALLHDDSHLTALDPSIDEFEKRSRTLARRLEEFMRSAVKRERTLRRLSPMRLYGVERSVFLATWIRGQLAQLELELRAFRNDPRSADELAPSTRVKIQTVLRSILRTAVRAGMLGKMPALPPLPRVGRKVPRPMRRDDLDAILAVSSPSARVAFELAAFAGLRASEVRGLRWSDVDLKVGTIVVRRGITLGVETMPKSHHQRAIPIGPRRRATLEAAARAQKRAGREGWTFHDLRHFFVSELFRNGANPVAIQQLAGHSDGA